jgi:hypothetical protein
MEVFRESFPETLQSPPRQIFGIHPTKNKILVPIDLCILETGSSSPNFDIDANGKNILRTMGGQKVGSIQDFSIPPEGDIYPIVTIQPYIDLDPNQSFDLTGIKKIIAPNLVQAGDIVTIEGNSGKVLPSLNGNANSIDTFPFPQDSGINISAFRVQFNNSLFLDDIGSPIIMSDGSTLGMLLTGGKTVFVYPSSLIEF